MSRIRSIKPEFPQSETVGALSRDARLLFIQLWTVADDAGRARAASRMLASLLYPYDDDAPSLIEGWLSELGTSGCIHRYTVDGSQYLEIVNWLKHQKIDRPSKSKIPDPPPNSTNPREHSRALDADLGPGPGSGPGSGAEPRARERFAAIEEELSRVAGESPCAADPDISPIVRLLDAGWSMEGHILPGVRDLIRREKRPGSWKYVAAVLVGRASDAKAQGPPDLSRPETAAQRFARKTQQVDDGDVPTNSRIIHSAA